MNVRAILIWSLTVFYSFAFGQTIQRSSINSFGSVVKSENIQLSQTVGQSSLTSVVSSNGYVLRQGFQQPITRNFVSSDNSVSINVFPNPSKGSFQIQFDGIRNVDYEYHIIDNQGRVCKSGQGSDGSNTVISMYDDTQSGSYTLKVILENREVGVARLIIMP